MFFGPVILIAAAPTGVASGFVTVPTICESHLSAGCPWRKTGASSQKLAVKLLTVNLAKSLASPPQPPPLAWYVSAWRCRPLATGGTPPNSPSDSASYGG